ncbi:LOW QUALITY PROTEIN: homeobox protein goosecoid-like [Mus pahari]|uniref:LOW QUALITY PROTEIN: homeobox protein goosecoid-like n=1 Tax=Mus pahari TaxID=10093 RepID=UPI000A306AC6|nr:LOW QUALITY PROTEIN: homeobox protein goosecoid-like [Mus pahari]
MAKISFLHPKFQMSSNTPVQTSSLVPKEPTRNLPFQICQSPLVTPRSPMQPSLSVPERYLRQQESQGPARKSSTQMQPGPVMSPGLPTLRRHSGHPSHQIPSRPSMRSGFQGSLGPMALSHSYGDQQTSLEAPRKSRKIRTVYIEERKCLLQAHLDQCKSPDLEQCMALALLTGVTEYEIQIWFKNRQAKECQKKGPQLPGRIGSGPHYRPTSNNGGEVYAFTASPVSVCQRHLDANCPPQFKSLMNSPHQEFNLSLID